MWVFLSHPASENAPAYGGGEGFKDLPDKRMAAGDSCNTRQWTFSNHNGTHIDFPRHFAASGATVDDYPAEFFIFGHVGVLYLPDAAPGQLLGPEELDRAGLADVADAEFLLLRTGFAEKREEEVYWRNNPGLHPDLAEHLRRTLPALRVVGFDCISLSSFAHRETGRVAHKAFLEHERPLLPLEDMDLRPLGTRAEARRIRQAVVSPFRALGADAAPCTVFAELA